MCSAGEEESEMKPEEDTRTASHSGSDEKRQLTDEEEELKR